MLRSVPGERILVFVGQKRNADFLASYLSQSGFNTTSIHGDRSGRAQREIEQKNGNVENRTDMPKKERKNGNDEKRMDML